MRTQVWVKNISLVIAWVFLFNALMPSLVQASVTSFSQTSNLSGTQADNAGKILICTARGYKWVDLHELETMDQSERSEQHFECPLCYSALSPLAILQPDAEIRVPLPGFIHKVNFRLQLKSKQKQNLFLITTLKRGPPLFA